jgi:tripartite-type tricarboxylate transporter receptor subunit TctC
MLVAGGGHMVINPVTNRSLPYDTERDFAPVAINFQAPSFVAVSANGPYKTMGDIVAAARSNPGKVAAGTQYLGSTQHLTAVMIELMSKTQMLHVPFKENSQLFASLINGDIGWTLATKATADPFVKSGRVRLISHTAKSRLGSHPDLPTLEETGVGRMDSSVWAGIFVPRATPADRVAQINRDIMKAIAEPDFQQRIASMGLELPPHSPADFAQLIRSDFRMYGEVVQRGNIKLE